MLVQIYLALVNILFRCKIQFIMTERKPNIHREHGPKKEFASMLELAHLDNENSMEHIPPPNLSDLPSVFEKKPKARRQRELTARPIESVPLRSIPKTCNNLDFEKSDGS